MKCTLLTGLSSKEGIYHSMPGVFTLLFHGLLKVHEPISIHGLLKVHEPLSIHGLYFKGKESQ